MIVKCIDNALAKVYDLRVLAWFPLYPTNIAEKDFTIEVVENCETAMDVTPSA